MRDCSRVTAACLAPACGRCAEWAVTLYIHDQPIGLILCARHAHDLHAIFGRADSKCSASEGSACDLEVRPLEPEQVVSIDNH
jgi:hypothetical protein